MEGERREYRMKFLCCGSANAGKTSIIKRYVNDIFYPHYKSTVGVDFALKVVDVSESLRVHLQLWDIAGQETFGSMTRIYKNAVAAILVFDLTDADSFTVVEKWRQDIMQHLPDEAVPILLLGNKIDLVDNPTKLGTPLEVSAKMNKDINEPIISLLQKALEVVEVVQIADPSLVALVNHDDRVEVDPCCV